MKSVTLCSLALFLVPLVGMTQEDQGQPALIRSLEAAGATGVRVETGMKPRSSNPALRMVNQFSIEVEKGEVVAEPLLGQAEIRRLIEERLEERELPVLTGSALSELAEKGNRSSHLKTLNFEVILQRTKTQEWVGLIRVRLTQPNVLMFGGNPVKTQSVLWEDGGVLTLAGGGEEREILETHLLERVDAFAEAFLKAKSR